MEEILYGGEKGDMEGIWRRKRRYGGDMKHFESHIHGLRLLHPWLWAPSWTGQRSSSCWPSSPHEQCSAWLSQGPPPAAPCTAPSRWSSLKGQQQQGQRVIECSLIKTISVPVSPQTPLNTEHELVKQLQQILENITQPHQSFCNISAD